MSLRVPVAAVFAWVLSGCTLTTWTAIHAGHGFVPDDRSLVGVDARRAIGTEIHSTYVAGGVRVDGNPEQLETELHVGLMHPARVSERVTLAPSAWLDLVRVRKSDQALELGFAGPELGLELLYWAAVEHELQKDRSVFGCRPVPAPCRIVNVERQGIGVRLSAEYDFTVLPGDREPGWKDATVWLTVGVSHAFTTREERLHP
jgi:hypothetical protein